MKSATVAAVSRSVSIKFAKWTFSTRAICSFMVNRLHAEITVEMVAATVARRLAAAMPLAVIIGVVNEYV